MKFTAKQERFCREYLIDCNATQSAIRAGYSRRTASSIGERLLRNVEVSAKISESKAKINEKLSLEADFVLSKLIAIAGFSIKKIANFDGHIFTFKPMDEWPKGAAIAIASIKQNTVTTTTKKGTTTVATIDIKFESKQAACVSLGQHLGLFMGYEQLVKAADSFGMKLVNVDKV
jgi:phage terminase small subunit